MPRGWAIALILLVGFTAAPAAGASLSGSGSACDERIANGGFEEGGAGWSQVSARGNDLISDFRPHFGIWGAYLGGVNDADDKLTQQITLPAAAVSITLTAWWAIATEEEGVGFDRMTVSLLKPDHTLLANLLSVDSSATVNVWEQAELDLTDYRGQTVILQFHAATDASNLTDFYVDDVSLAVCRPTTAVYLPIITR
jgi:uncharacterized protein (DUF736 family)